MRGENLLKRGEIYFANLDDPPHGHEQGKRRPVVILQRNELNRIAKTVVIVPFTTNLKTARLPSSILVKAGNGGLISDSVALCNQIRVLDKRRLDSTSEGTLPSPILKSIEQKVAEVLLIKK